MVVNSVTRVGYFWKILATNFLAKVSQIFGDFLGYLENTAFEEITVMATFWATLQKKTWLFLFQLLVALVVSLKASNQNDKRRNGPNFYEVPCSWKTQNLLKTVFPKRFKSIKASCQVDSNFVWESFIDLRTVWLKAVNFCRLGEILKVLNNFSRFNLVSGKILYLTNIICNFGEIKIIYDNAQILNK